MNRQQILTMVFGYLLIFIGLVIGMLFITEAQTGLLELSYFALFLALLMVWVNSKRIIKAIFAFIYRDRIGARKTDPNSRLGKKFRD